MRQAAEVRRSPWERALGDQTTALAPRLRAYFGPIPVGSVGRAIGTFDVVGTPRRWLWPALALLAVEGVAFPVWQRSVPFTVTNRPTRWGTVRARREFHFESGDAVMIDEIGITASGLTDRLGEHGLVSSTFRASVADGRLVLRSTGVALRLGRIRVPLGPLSPRVVLVERSDGSRQHVSLRMMLPIVGTVYEYAGSFSYRIVKDDRG